MDTNNKLENEEFEKIKDILQDDAVYNNLVLTDEDRKAFKLHKKLKKAEENLKQRFQTMTTEKKYFSPKERRIMKKWRKKGKVAKR